jgi:DNA-binding MarR family transcriptional regulator
MPPTMPQEHPHVSVFYEIGAIEHYMRAAVSRHLPPGMSHTQFELLGYFARNGDGQTPAELARILLMTKGAMTALLQKMEQTGHVAVLADCADRRKKRVRITRAGLDVYGCVQRNLKTKVSALREGFTDNEFRAAIPFLRALHVFLAELAEAPIAAAMREEFA